MSEYKEAQLAAFQKELRKVAFTFNPKSLGSLGAFGGVGMGVGGLAGGAAGAVKGYRRAKEEGTSAAGGALGGALHGAQVGALTGGAVGAAGGALGAHLRPEQFEKLRAGLSRDSAFARFGQRQVHALTGHVPEGGLASIRHGASGRLESLGKAKKNLANKTDSRTWGDKLLRRTPEEVNTTNVRRAQQSYDAGRAAEEAGLTSIPGYAKSVRDRGLLPTVGIAARDQLAGTSLPTKLLTVGLPAMQVASAASRDSEDFGPGRTKGESIGEGVAGLASGLAMSPLPLTTQIAAGIPIAAAGRAMGRMFDRRRVQPPDQAGGV